MSRRLPITPDEVLREFARSTDADLGRLLASASHAINTALMTRLARAGHSAIRPSHVAVFTGLEPGGTQISTLAQRAGISRQALSAVVREVEALGYVRTSPDPHDRRAVRVELTDTGVAFCLAAIEISRELTREVGERWGAEALDETRSRLRSLAGDPPVEPRER